MLAVTAAGPLAAPGCGPGRAEAARAKVVAVIGEMGRGPGQLFYPRSVAVNARGEVAAVDKSGRIQLFGGDGSSLLSFDLPERSAGQPTGINFDRSGRLLVADSHYHRVLVYGRPDPAAGPPPLERSFGTEGAGDAQFTLVRDIVEDSRGCLHVGDYDGPEDRIETFSGEGSFVRAFGRRGSGDGEFQRPQGLAIERRPGGEEYLLVADCSNHRVQRFSIDGRFAGAFGRLGSGPGELKYPYAVASVPAGAPGGPAVLVVEWGNNRIQTFDLDGRPRGAWGGPGRGPGELATPWDAALGPDGRIFVADYGNHRIQVLAAGALAPGPVAGGPPVAAAGPPVAGPSPVAGRGGR